MTCELCDLGTSADHPSKSFCRPLGCPDHIPLASLRVLRASELVVEGKALRAFCGLLEHLLAGGCLFQYPIVTVMVIIIIL